jgi:hypothetical protein
MSCSNELANPGPSFPVGVHNIDLSYSICAKPQEALLCHFIRAIAHFSVKMAALLSLICRISAQGQAM